MTNGTLGVTLAIVAWTAGCDATRPDPKGLQPATVIWQVQLPAFGPPAFDDNSIYFALRDHRIAAVNRATGIVRWIRSSGQTGSNLITRDTPVRANSVVVFGDEHLYAFDPATGTPMWTFTGSDGGDAPRVGIYSFKTDGSVIYAGSVVGAAFAVDAATGAQLWRSDLLPGTDNQVRVMAVRDGRVFICMRYDGLAYSGMVYALDAESGTVLWTYELPREPDMRNGTRDAILWVNELEGDVPAFIVSFDDGRIVALRAATGTALWIIPRMEGLNAQNDQRYLTASAGVLVSSSNFGMGTLVGYDLATGSKMWQVASDQGSSFAIASDTELAFVPLSSGNLGAYDLQTGARRWLRGAPGGSFFFSSPVVSRDTLFLGGYEAAYAIRK